MKSIWKGTISFGLVSIPIVLYTASESKGISFNLLHNKDKSPIKYKKWCEAEDKEVEWKDIVKGLEIAKDTYFVLTQEELEALKPEKTSSVDIKGFIDRSQIDDIYLDNNYFVAPQNEKDKAFFLFKEALIGIAKIAVGNFVMHEKEHLCLIRSYKNGMLLTTLKYANEVRDINTIEALDAKVKISDSEMKLAHELISKLEFKDFDINDYHETFSQELKELIKRKANGEKIPAKKPKERKEESLIQALKASIK